jgi:hypothetical protein
VIALDIIEERSDMLTYRELLGIERERDIEWTRRKKNVVTYCFTVWINRGTKSLVTTSGDKAMLRSSSYS